jgi:hypothetical protein
MQWQNACFAFDYEALEPKIFSLGWRYSSGRTSARREDMIHWKVEVQGPYILVVMRGTCTDQKLGARRALATK